MDTIIITFSYKGKSVVLFYDLDLDPHLPQHWLCNLLSTLGFDRTGKNMVHVQKDTAFYFETSAHYFDIMNHCVAHKQFVFI